MKINNSLVRGEESFEIVNLVVPLRLLIVEGCKVK